MKRRHEMGFGAMVLDDGAVRFRLWAPAARQVGLCLDGEPRPLPLAAAPDGWFELTTREASRGTRYRFRIDDELSVPDPASRHNPQDVDGPSAVVDPFGFDWDDEDWLGRRWEDAVIYELHVGTFTPEGTFAAIEAKLDHLCRLGATALELMPIGDFSGARGWGYDGVLPFAPDASYGEPAALKRLVVAAHRRGLMVFLDVVYNHFGPVGNYLHRYAPQFFTSRHRTPWGHAINFDGAESRVVRDFFIDNALYWLDEFHFDGLRLDAVHSIRDDSAPDFLDELAATVRRRCARGRHVHLILENDDNAANYLARESDGATGRYTAQWNDDIHHTLHTCLTSERDGYYIDYADTPLEHLGRCLTAGFAYQGEHSSLRGRPRGSSTAGLPLTAFVSFLQNHDQIGNRAFGERLTVLAEPVALATAIAIVLLAPSPPLLFMGEEFGATTPFLYFCDFDPDLAEAVRAGRLNEFARFARMDAASAAAIPDPQAAETFTRSKLDWESCRRSEHAGWLARYRELLLIRRNVVIPMLAKLDRQRCGFAITGPRSLTAHWSTDDGARLLLFANLGGAPDGRASPPPGKLVYTTGSTVAQALASPWSTTWMLTEERIGATRDA
ncbi:MAG TPA: malto-oligosyltrehalose trehalohydrolase [Casimicrobiaceae bacterium]|nr:malto-oligosyltrehalose trehalohydrolase [Casimicrobiaceae bacterium]